MSRFAPPVCTLASSLRALSALAISLLLAAVLAACGTTTEIVCDPTCPNGTHCTDTGCVPDDPNQIIDLSVGPTPDLAGACSPACGGATPFCREARCVVCLADKDCPTGQVCKPSGAITVCATGCADDSRCGGGANKCCAGACLDTSKDPQNCGTCGNACGSQHSRATCTAGVCTPGACNAGWGDCNMLPADGCETNLRIDANNCAACGVKCAFPNTIAACSDACYIAACAYGFDDCNGEDKDGCETSVQSDVKNCGGCGMACAAVPNAKNTCQNASCILTGCNQGFSDCDGKPANGCEVTTGTDVNNCGACGNKCGQGLACINSACTCQNCVLPNAKTRCVMLQCLFDVCLPGYGNCDNNTQNGCEADFTADPKNCGGCGVVCPQNLPFCNNSACVAQPPCKNLGGGGQVHDNGIGMNELYCYDVQDNTEVRARKACEAHFGIGKCCVIQGGYNSQQYGECNLGGGQGSIHWHYDSHPNGHCPPNYVVGDTVSPGWCGNTLGNFIN